MKDVLDHRCARTQALQGDRQLPAFLPKRSWTRGFEEDGRLDV